MVDFESYVVGNSLAFFISTICLVVSSFSPDVFHASVVFGIGKELYCTESVEGSDPEWHQEAVM